MSYTGAVTVGGPAQVRELPGLVISKVAVGPVDNNAYLLRCRRTGTQVLVDAAAEPERLVALCGPDGLAAVITTHRHTDHWTALAAVVAATGARTMAHPIDAEAIAVETDILLGHDQRIAVGEVGLQVIHLRGHTPGSVALAYDDPDGHSHLFTGDSLFPKGRNPTTGEESPGGPGNTFGSSEDFALLLGDLQARVFDRFADETWLYPGHGQDGALGDLRPDIRSWRDRGW